MRNHLIWPAFVMTLSLTLPGLAAAQVDLFLILDESDLERPEGIAVNKRGDIFISIAPLGQVWKIPAGSTDPELFGSVPNPMSDVGLLGLAVDAPGNVYGAAPSPVPAVHGVWKFDRRSGTALKLAGTEIIAFPNDVAFDKRGNLYITDSAGGAIWRVPQGGGTTELWLSDVLLDPGAFGFGANGIEYFQGTLYVAVTDQGHLVGVPVLPDGSPGTPRIVADFNGSPPDGLAIDVHGHLYVAMLVAQQILKVDPADGTTEVIEMGDPLDFPSSLAFGTGRGEQQVLFGVNFSIGELFGSPPVMRPGVFATDVGQPGNPLP